MEKLWNFRQSNNHRLRDVESRCIVLYLERHGRARQVLNLVRYFTHNAMTDTSFLT